MSGRFTAKDILSKKKAASRVVSLVLDADLAERWGQAQAQLERAKGASRVNPDSETAKLAVIEAEDLVEELQPQVAENTAEIKLQAMGRRAYEELVSKHPPTEQQKKEVKRANPNQQAIFNAETFMPALLAASIVDPPMTEDEVKEMYDSENFNSAELELLALAAIEVNNNTRVIDLKGASSLIHA